MADATKNGSAVPDASDTATRTQTRCACPLSSPPNAAAAPCWLRDGKLQPERLKAEIAQCTENLSTEEDEAQQGEGAELLYKTIMNIWGLETGQLSRSAADLACDEIR